MNTTNCLEQRQVRTECSVLAGERHEHWGTRVAVLVHRVTKTRDKLALFFLQTDRFTRDFIPFGFGALVCTNALQFFCKKYCAVFGDTTEA